MCVFSFESEITDEAGPDGPQSRASGCPALDRVRTRKVETVFETHAGEIDVVLTDIVMPGKSGLELAGRFRLMLPKRSCLNPA